MSIKDFTILAKLGTYFHTKDKAHTPPSTRSKDSLTPKSMRSKRSNWAIFRTSKPKTH